MKKFEVKDHEPSLLPDGEWKLVWSDEFDGYELDRTKWDYRLNMMGQRWISWTDKGVHLDGNSNAVFTLIEEDGKLVCSQLQTGYNYMDEPVQKTKFGNDALQWRVGKLHENLYTKKYGYFECRCRLQQKNGWWSAFWMQSPNIGSTLDPADSGTEIDIMESFVPGNIAPHNAFTGGYGLDMKRAKVGGHADAWNENREYLPKEEFHTFGMEWDENGYTFYIDGKEDGHISDFVSHRPEFILISTEVSGYRSSEERKPKPAAYDALGDTFLVDYVRVYDRIG